MDRKHRQTVGVRSVTNRISTKFALLLAAAAIVPLLGYGALSVFSLRTGAQQAVIDGNLNVARQVAEQIELYITGSVNILKAVAADLEQTGLQQWQKDRILKNFVLQFPEFRELTLLDDYGSSSRVQPAGEAVDHGARLGRRQYQRGRSSHGSQWTTICCRPRSWRSGCRTDGGGWLVGRLNLEETVAHGRPHPRRTRTAMPSWSPGTASSWPTAIPLQSRAWLAATICSPTRSLRHECGTGRPGRLR